MNIVEKIVKKKLVGDSRKVDKRSQKAFEAALLAQGVSKGKVKSAVKGRKAVAKAALKKIGARPAKNEPETQKKGSPLLRLAAAAIRNGKSFRYTGGKRYTQ